MRIAIMQPYFLPYAGYFRLFHATDLFVIYDCVQFIRRGWIHRNRFSNANGELSWFTLPLLKAPRDIKISELGFLDAADQYLRDQQNKFPLFTSAAYLASEFNDSLLHCSQHPVSYITHLLSLTCNKLQLPFNVAYSSQLQLPAELKGQDRIISIANYFHADEYINPPGGRELYDEDTFKQHNIKLTFLRDYIGSYESILPRLISEDISALRNEITSQ